MADGLRAWGWVEEDELARVLVLSPHPDDAVLSCGQFLARHPGTTVVTVFCGIPATYPDPPRRWEQLAGFAPGDDVAALRREEDRRALAVLDAYAVHLDGFPEADFPAAGRAHPRAVLAARPTPGGVGGARPPLTERP